MRKVSFLCLIVLLFAKTSSAQEKSAWTANPALVYQQNKLYPSPVTVRLFSNNCYGKNGTVATPLKPADGYTIAVTGVGVSASAPVVGDCSLTTTLTITAATQPGFQMLTVKKGSDDAGFALFDFMDATAGPIPAAPQVDVLWEVLTDHLCKDNFGNHMPGDLYCVETKIGNNSGHALQLAGVGFWRKSPQCKSRDTLQPCTGDTNVGISTPNISYLTVRASAQEGQSTTTRNIIVNGTQALGLLMGSFTPFFLNNFNKSRWATGSTIVGTSLAQAINIIAPDQTVKEINNLDDQAFRDGKLIPNNTQVRLLVFVQKKSVAEAIGEVIPRIQDANEVQCTNPMTVGYKPVRGRTGQCYPAWEDGLKNCIKKLVCDPLIVKIALGKMVIIGDQIEFIQRVVVDSSVTSQEVGVPGKQILSALSAKLSATHGSVNAPVTITGTGLGTTGKVKFFDGVEAKTISWTDTKIELTVPDGAKTGKVTLTVGGVDTDLGTFTVDPASAVTPKLSPTHGAVKTPVTITGTGLGTTGTVKFNGVEAKTTSWTDTKIELTVPDGAKTGKVTLTVRGVDTDLGTFTVDPASAGMP